MNMSVTLVSAYYRFNSKHSHHDYDSWLSNFLGTVETNLVMFCDEDTRDMLKQLRGNKPMHVVVLPAHEWECSQNHFDWNIHHSRDPERDIHTTTLYKLWNEKPFFVERAIKLNPYKSDWFFWTDAGCFRDSSPHVLQSLRHWPYSDAWTQLPADKLTLQQMKEFQAADYQIHNQTMLPREYQYDGLRIAGTFMVGTIRTWAKWLVLWRGIIHTYIHAAYFAGKDQDMMNTLVTMFPDMVNLVSSHPAKRNPWFYMHEYFT